VRVIASGHASIDPNAEIFKRRSSPLIVLVCENAPPRRVNTLRELADEVVVFGRDAIDFRQACRWLRKSWKVRSLLCEGGGEVNGALFEAGLVNELYLTICPIILGGRKSPTPVDGHGVAALSDAVNMIVQRMKRVGDELFLSCRVYPKTPSKLPHLGNPR